MPGRIDHLLTIVEHEEHGLVANERCGVDRCLVGQAQSGRDRGTDGRAVVDDHGGEVDEERAVPIAVGTAASDLDGQARLAASARSHDGHQVLLGQQPRKVVHLGVASYEAASRSGQVVTLTHTPQGRRGGAKTLADELKDTFRSRHSPQSIDAEISERAGRW